MTKPISIRLDEAVIQLLKDRSAEAGVSQADYVAGLITSGPTVASESPTAPESERIQSMMAAAVVAQNLEAELRDEIRELKRELRESKEPDAPRRIEQKIETGAKLCPHGEVWKLCKWSMCRSTVPRVDPPGMHRFHSGTSPKSGCGVCAALVTK